MAKTPRQPGPPVKFNINRKPGKQTIRIPVSPKKPPKR